MVIFKTGSSLIKSGDRLTGLKTDLFWDASAAAPPTSNTQTDGAGTWTAANQWKTAEGTNATNRTWFNGARAIFGNGGTGGAVTLTPYANVYGIVLKTYTGTYTLGTVGREIRLYQGIDKRVGSGACVITCPIWLQSDNVWTNDSSTNLTINSGQFINNNGYKLTINVNGTGNVSVSSINLLAAIIYGSGGITKNGPGLLQFGGANSDLSGPIEINGGILRCTNTSEPFGTGNIKISNGILDFYWSASFTRSLGNGPGQIQITGGESGFSQNGGAQVVTITLDKDTTNEYVWGSTYFNPSKLVFNVSTSQSGATVSLNNKMDLNGVTRTIVTTGGVAGNAIGIISGVIRNSTGTAGIIKDGAGQLKLGSANTFNGDFEIKAGSIYDLINNSFGSGAGTVRCTGNAAFTSLHSAYPIYSNNLVIDAGVTLTFYSGSQYYSIAFAGILSGSGILTTSSGVPANASRGNADFQNTANTFSGPVILIGAGGGGITRFNSLPDNSSYIRMSGGLVFQMGAGAIAPMIFSNKQFQLSGNSISGSTIENLNASTSNILSIAQPLGYSSVGSNKTLVLGGTNTGLNEFSGVLANPSGYSLAVQKSGLGNWIVSGNNTFTGGIRCFQGSGPLIFQGVNSISSGNTVIMDQSGSSSSALRLLADGSTNVFPVTIAPDNRNSSTGIILTIGNTSAANGGSSNGSTTNATTSITLMRYTNGGGSGAGGFSAININNGYTLEIPQVTFQSSSTATNWVCNFTPVGGNILITGDVTPDNGHNNVTRYTTLALGGSSSNNIIQGVIRDAYDFTSGSNPTATALRLSKLGTSTWTLQGVNTYTGATDITAGTLIVTGSLHPSSAVNINASTLEGSNLNGGTATIGAVTLTNTLNATIRAGAFGNNILYMSGLTINTGVNSRLSFHSTSSTFSKIVVSSGVNLNGVGIILPAGMTTLGVTYDLLECTSGSLTGTAVISSNLLGGGRIPVLTYTATKLQVTVN